MRHVHSKWWIAAAASALLAAPAMASQPGDAWITTKVKFRLIRHPGIAPLSMNVDTHDGVVTLFGSISTEDGRREAGLEASKVSGVAQVQNELQVVSKDAEREVGKRDAEIRKAVAQRIDERDALRHENIGVEVANGVVRLSGSVEHPDEHIAALSLARSTQGVQAVVDDLRTEI
ncbi:MAG TPA: BON domain-containing protein [Myxococcota bacterium]|nr:BON domain-containing protein [Myxococcota bacterium]